MWVWIKLEETTLTFLLVFFTFIRLVINSLFGDAEVKAYKTKGDHKAEQDICPWVTYFVPFEYFCDDESSQDAKNVIHHA